MHILIINWRVKNHNGVSLTNGINLKNEYI